MGAVSSGVTADGASGARFARRVRATAASVLMAGVLVAWGAPVGAADSEGFDPPREMEVPVTSAWSASSGGSAAAAAAANVPSGDRATVDSITRLYLAVLGRLPDPDGHRYWVSRYQAGDRLVDLAGSFMLSPEWTNRYGTVGDERFVDLLYGNVLDRVADPDGGAYWRSTLGDGIGRSEVVLQFSQSSEFVNRTGTTSPRPPYPPVPAESGSGRRIVYGGSAQRVWLIKEDDSVYDSYLVSGRRDTPNPGTYTVYSKSPRAWAGHGGITMNHMVRFARGRSLAIGFHSIPTRAGGTPLQSLAQLGTYQSAGCVRQQTDKAELLYRWADIGTTVVVLD